MKSSHSSLTVLAVRYWLYSKVATSMPSLFSMTGGASQKYYSQHIKEPEFLHGKCMLNFCFTALASCLKLYDSLVFNFLYYFPITHFFL